MNNIKCFLDIFVILYVLSGVYGADTALDPCDPEEWVVKSDSFSAVQWAGRLMGSTSITKMIGTDDHYVIETDSCRNMKGKRTRWPRSTSIQWAMRQTPLVRVKRLNTDPIVWNDPYYERMWHVNRASKGQGYDMNVEEAWRLGYTGMGVVVSIMDDGIDYTHPDLWKNYEPTASIDLNGKDSDPMPDTTKQLNRHGTRCAGQVAAQGNNSVCVVGIAYESKIGGIRMLDGVVNDRLEAEAISFNRDLIDIYSGSWGPEDSGKMYEGPGPLTTSAFKKGVAKGRYGKGSIFIWASGNGGSHGDSCASDGYVSNPYTVSVSSVTESNTRPWYLESCSSTLISTYSSGGSGEKMISTVDLYHSCADNHTGTSASAPIAAAMIALLLEANPRLTWRDVQYIVVLTANPAPLKDGNFTINGVGRPYSPWFGYGLMDAGKMVRLGELWRGVPAYHTCKSASIIIDKPLVGRFNHTIPFTFNACTKLADGAAGSSSTSRRSAGDQESGLPVNFLEHVQVYTDINYSRRGLLQLSLISPSGTLTVLQPPRTADTTEGDTSMARWPVDTVQLWGEEAAGTWYIRLDNIIGLGMIHTGPVTGYKGKWGSVWMELHGSETQPIRLKPPAPDRMPPKDWFRTFEKYIVNDSDWHKAYTCHPECFDGCRGPAADECDVDGCRNYETTSGQCVAVCPTGTTPFSADLPDKLWPDKPLQTTMKRRSSPLKNQVPICRPCSANCATCLRPNSAHECMTCVIGLFLVPAPSSPITDAQRRSALNRIRSWPTDLQSERRQLMALDDLVLHINNSNVGSCQKTCPRGYFMDQSGTFCRQCPEDCDQCGGAKLGSCSVCRQGFRLVNGNCVDGVSVDGKCPKGEFLLRSKCASCSPTCSSDGCLPNGQCIRCKEEFAYLFNYTCMPSCPSGWFAELPITGDQPSSLECRLCPPGCVACHAESDGSVNCASCLPNLAPRNGQCQWAPKRKPLLTYQQDSVNSNCSSNCHRCTDAAGLNCLSCASSDFYLTPTYLLPKTGSLAAGYQPMLFPSAEATSYTQALAYKCLSTCPSQGSYPAELQDKRTCLPCPVACLSCTDPNHCSSCRPNFQLDSKTNLCVPTDLCRQSQFFDQPTNTCQECDQSCRTCSGPTPHNCTSCARSQLPPPRCLLPEPVTSQPLQGQCRPCCSYVQLLMNADVSQCMFCAADSAYCQKLLPDNKGTVPGHQPSGVPINDDSNVAINNSANGLWSIKNHPLRFMLIGALIVLGLLTGICSILLLLAYRNHGRIGMTERLQRMRNRRRRRRTTPPSAKIRSNGIPTTDESQVVLRLIETGREGSLDEDVGKVKRLEANGRKGNSRNHVIYSPLRDVNIDSSDVPNSENDDSKVENHIDT